MSPTWLRSRVRRYAADYGLGYVPRVVFSAEEWQRATPKKQWKRVEGETLGCAWDGVVFLNLSLLCCRRNSDDTCAHETLHFLRPEMNHGKRFSHMVSEMLLGRAL